MHAVVKSAGFLTRHLGQDLAAASFLGDRLGTVVVPPYEIIGIFRHHNDGELTLAGGFIITNKSTCNVDLALYAPGCMTRRVMADVARYIFVGLKCERITGRCRRSNQYIRRLLPRLGWELEGVQRRFFGPTRHDDAMIYGLLASELPEFLKGD